MSETCDVTIAAEKPPAGLWRFDPETPEGKYMLVRRDGTVPEWPFFAIGAKDPAAPAALRAYADECRRLKMNSDYVNDLYRLAGQFARYRHDHGDGDPDRGRHRKDDPATIEKMRVGASSQEVPRG